MPAENDREFTAAFIVVSEEPASDEAMEHVMRLQETFGNYMRAPDFIRYFFENFDFQNCALLRLLVDMK